MIVFLRLVRLRDCVSHLQSPLRLGALILYPECNEWAIYEAVPCGVRLMFPMEEDIWNGFEEVPRIGQFSLSLPMYAMGIVSPLYQSRMQSLAFIVI